MQSENMVMTMTSWKGVKAKGIHDHMLQLLKAHLKRQFLLCIYTHADLATGQLCNTLSVDGTVALYNNHGDLQLFPQ